ncbi:MAG: glycine--tRNA ligase subunit beta [Pseudomonadota bacterium]|nr:glycine--tRNA ligase subunit beta [Pseudomonadota bacterium]
MPEFFVELFSEEIPARMQAAAAAELERLVLATLAPLQPHGSLSFHGPRRIAIVATLDAEVAATSSTERGPRLSAPEQALAGFLRKHDVSNDRLRQENGYWLLEKTIASVPAQALVAEAMPGLLRRFPWPKSMRWGGRSAFTWVRPLRRIICLLDGVIVPFDLREGADDGHGLASSDLTEGHRFHAPAAFAVNSCADWRERLTERCVLVDAAERRRRISTGIEIEAAKKQVIVARDPGLLDEIAGLVEWPVPLLGRIDPAFMTLPPEVMQVSMRVNQRYFAMLTSDGVPAPWFGFVANVESTDDCSAIIAGNERVLRARFADARHFWELDKRTSLASRLPLLEKITFHAKLGSQGDRVRRLRRLARAIAPVIGACPEQAERSACLAKADLVTGMVGEFPELQGVMGRYYALHDGEHVAIADAIRDHYAPKGPSDAVPAEPVSIAVALADKFDLLSAFFAIGETPTGSGDPYALRRAALGIIRIIRENSLHITLSAIIREAGSGLKAAGFPPAPETEIRDFVAERLRVQLRAEGARYDVLAAVFAARADDDLVRLLACADAVASLLGTADGANLLTAYRRAANILRIEERKDGPHDGLPNHDLFRQPEELALTVALDSASRTITAELAAARFASAMAAMACLRAPLDAFFDRVTVNASEPELRRNRLRLLSRVRETVDRIADFSKIEG